MHTMHARLMFLSAFALVFFVACAAKEVPPLEAPPGVLDPIPTLAPYSSVPASAPATVTAPEGPPAPPVVAAPPPAPIAYDVPGMSALRPAQVIEQANLNSRITPSLTGYSGASSSILVYPVLLGRTYEVYTAPGSPTTLLLPLGETLAAPPTLNPEEWDVGDVTMATRQALILRPVKAGVIGTTPLLFQSGKIFFVWVKAFEKTSIAAVSWE